MNEANDPLGRSNRYSRQIRLSGWGTAAQQTLSERRVLVVGVGALGSISADLLARAGVGFLRLVDRDFVELSNLQRQALYTEADVAAGTPKAIAAAVRLREINSEIQVEGRVADVTSDMIRELADDVDLIVDGSDNFEVRFLINDYAVETRKPWVYAGCLGYDGQVMMILPGQDACLRCLLPDGPPTAPGTCDTVGVSGPAVHGIAAAQSLEALKWLGGRGEAVIRGLQAWDFWNGRHRVIPTLKLWQQQRCPTCQGSAREWLNGSRCTQSQKLCGRNSVQVSPPSSGLPAGYWLDWLPPSDIPSDVIRNPYLIRFSFEDLRVTVFADGRAIFEGTEDLTRARNLYQRWFG